MAPEIPTMFISGDEDSGKVLAMAYCPKSAIEKGLKVTPAPVSHVLVSLLTLPSPLLHCYTAPSLHCSPLQANEWCGSVLPLIGGKGGGKPDNAQGSGANVANLGKALQVSQRLVG